jgi:hypothetical protein
MSAQSDRKYRPLVPSDLPNIQSGKLKAFWDGAVDGSPRPARLVSTNYINHKDGTLWVYEGIGSDVICNSTLIVVDVTPEKRYAIWNHKTQRFQFIKKCADDGEGFTSRQDAMIWLESAFPSLVRENLYIVEWEIKSDD